MTLTILAALLIPAAQAAPAGQTTPACQRYAQEKARLSQAAPAVEGQDPSTRLNGFLGAVQALDQAKAACEASKAAPGQCTADGQGCARWTPNGFCAQPFANAHCAEAARKLRAMSEGQYCNDGGQCSGLETCRDHRCVSNGGCRTDADCPWQQHCQMGSCWLGNGGECHSDFDCRFGNRCENGKCQGPW